MRAARGGRGRGGREASRQTWITAGCVVVAHVGAGSLTPHADATTRRYFDSGDAFSGAGKKEDPLETGVEKRETLAVVQGQLDGESEAAKAAAGESEAAKAAAEVARKNAEAEAAFKKKFGNVKPSAGALLHRQRKHEVCNSCVSFVLIVPLRDAFRER